MITAGQGRRHLGSDIVKIGINFFRELMFLNVTVCGIAASNKRRRMPQASELTTFLRDYAGAQLCSQCRTKMTIETVEPHLIFSDADTHTYRCINCGLADKLEIVLKRYETHT